MLDKAIDAQSNEARFNTFIKSRTLFNWEELMYGFHKFYGMKNFKAFRMHEAETNRKISILQQIERVVSEGL